MKDPYLYPGTNVLINYFDIKDSDKLSRVESNIFNKKYQADLPEGNFDLPHLKSIHKHFFGEVYPWAGEIRTIDMAKSNSYFAHFSYIQVEADKLFKKLEKDNFLENVDKAQVPTKLSEYFNEINALHPFREGNGRTQRAFITELAKSININLCWENISKEAYIQASIDGFHSNDKPMTQIIKKTMQPMRSGKGEVIIQDKTKQKIKIDEFEKSRDFER